MPKTKLPIIRPALSVDTITDADLVQRITKVYDGMLNNPAYPTPPVDMPSFKAALDAYSAAVTAALDGGKAALIARDTRRADVVVMYRSLGHYVESACKNDLNTFVSSGFLAATTAQRGPAQPVAVPSISSIDQGSSGQLLVTISKVAKARSYNLRYAPVPAAGTTVGANVSWITTSVASTKPATPINNLTAGTTYQFQAQAFGKLGYSDWSDTVNRMCI